MNFERLIKLSLFLLFTPFSGLAVDNAYEWNDYDILETRKDPQLDENHAVFEIKSDQWVVDKRMKIELSCNGVIHKFKADSIPHNIDVSPGNYVFEMSIGKGYREILTSSITIQPGYRIIIQFHFRSSTENMHVRKPVIYVYSEQINTFDITVQPKGKFSFTYPQTDNGKWTGTTYPDGTISIANNSYPYLFWESEQQFLGQDFNAGFIVSKSEVIPFLEKQLSAMGLNEREQTDFITFWGPIMAQSEAGFAHFLFNEECDQLATMDVSPKPDQVFRLFLLWTPVQKNTKYTPRPQVIPKVVREGFYLIEWGGSEIPMKEAL